MMYTSFYLYLVISLARPRVYSRSIMLYLSRGHMLSLIGFHVCMLRWCSLHQLNLGPLVWSCGACLELLLKEAIWDRVEGLLPGVYSRLYNTTGV